MKHDHHHHASPAVSLDRRSWLKRSGAGLAGALGAGTIGNLMVGAKSAHAADYKALVCVFLYGGNDGMNTVVPTDDARYNQYAAVRKGLALPRNSLVNLSGINYGLHPALSALAPAWRDGALAPVFNVGTLTRPMSKAEYRAAANIAGAVPDNLFSHSDQQTQWESGTPSSFTRTGWAGRASVALNTVNPVISVSGSTRFGQSEQQSPLVLPSRPGGDFGAQLLQPADMTWQPRIDRKAVLDLMYSQSQDLALAEAFGKTQRNAFVVSERLSSLVKIGPKGVGANAVIDAAFAPIMSGTQINTGLGNQLYQVAKLIYGNATVQGSRQIFFTQMDNFDTHAGQSITGSPTEGVHARLLKELGDALGCFNTAMKNLGLGDAVTAFTQSDFGRTFVPNTTTGTDHGWGNHHLVVGGAVKGGASYGLYPDLTVGGQNDIGAESWELHGRWLPTTSVDQYAGTLLGWFGANDTQLRQILPNLGYYGTMKLGFV
jgi:uncharacterized protein (DUF1501 family)